jgi:hypothetical protein
MGRGIDMPYVNRIVGFLFQIALNLFTLFYEGVIVGK